MLRHLAVAVVVLAYVESCCQPDRYAAEFSMNLQIAGQMDATLEGTSYADYQANNFYWSGSGDIHFSQLPNPISMYVRVGIDSQDEVVWYSLESPLFKRCEAYQLEGGIPDGMKCVFDLFIPMDDGALISPDYLSYYENATVNDDCVPLRTKVMLREPIPAIIETEYGSASLGDEVDFGLRAHEMPSDCALAGKFTIDAIDDSDDDESDLKNLRKRSMNDHSSPIYRRLRKRDIFAFAKKYANRAMDNIKDAVNNPDKVINSVKDLVHKGKEAAGNAVDKVKEAYENRDEIMANAKDTAGRFAGQVRDKAKETYENRDEVLAKVKEAMQNGKAIGKKWKVAIEDAIEEE